MGRFRTMQEKYDIIGNVRGLGAMCALECVKDSNTVMTDSQLAEALDVIEQAVVKVAGGC